MKTIAEIKQSGKCHTEYNPHQREWLVGYPTGQIASFDAGQEGKTAALLSALTHDAPVLAGLVEATMQKHPTNRAFHNRLLKAAFIVRDEEVELLHRGHWRVQSQTNPETLYICSKHAETPNTTRCGCDDWHNGHAALLGEKGKFYAPFIPDFGIACKHVLAGWLYEQITPMFPCPNCNGQGFNMVKNPGNLWTSHAYYCDPCEGKGVLFDPEIADPGPAPRSPLDLIPPSEYEHLSVDDLEDILDLLEEYD